MRGSDMLYGVPRFSKDRRNKSKRLPSMESEMRFVSRGV